MSLKKSTLTDSERARLKRVLEASGTNLEKIRQAVINELKSVSLLNGRQYLFYLLTRHAEQTIKARLKKAKLPPRDDKRLKDLKFLARDARGNELFLTSRLGPNDD